MNKKIIASGLLSIFFLATGLLCTCGYDLFAQQTDLEGSEGFYTVFTGNMPGAALKPEKQVTVTGATIGLAAKDRFIKCFALSIPGDLYSSHHFIYYSSSSANLHSQLCRSSIIFPYHYFW